MNRPSLLKRTIVNTLSNFSFFKGNTFVRVPLLVPYHHAVSDSTPLIIKNLYSIKTTRQFQEDLEFLTSNYKSLDLADLMKSAVPPDNSFLLTFDDGLKEVYTNIAPELEKFGIKGVFFITTDFLDNKIMFYKHAVSLFLEEIKTSKNLAKAEKVLDKYDIYGDTISERLRNIPYARRDCIEKLAESLDFSIEEYLRREKPYLESWQLEELIKRGHYIGGHSLDHPYYHDLPLEEQVNQTFKSVNYLVERFKLDYRIFSIPHIDDFIEQKFFEIVLDEDNPDKLDLVFGNSKLKKETFTNNVIHRIIGENPHLDFKGYVNAHLLMNWGLTVLGRNFINRN